MTLRRFLLVVGVVVLGVVLFLGCQWYFTQRRARQLVEETLASRSEDTSVRTDGGQELAALADFSRFCQRISENAKDRERRKKEHEHCEDWIVQNLDSMGQPKATLTETLRVWYDGDAEKKELLARKADANVLRYLDAKYLLPFSGPETLDMYAYELEGVEKPDGRDLARIKCSPKAEVAGVFGGRAWVDVAAAEVVRFEGIAVKPPSFMEFLKIRVECKPFERAGIQLYFARSEAKIPLVGLHRQTRITYRDYQPRPAPAGGSDR